MPKIIVEISKVLVKQIEIEVDEINKETMVQAINTAEKIYTEEEVVLTEDDLSHIGYNIVNK